MKTKYKLLLFFLIVIFLIVGYLLLFSKPLIKIEDITITSAHEQGISCGMTDDDMKETAWILYDDAKDMNDHQQIWQGEKPSNENIDDYIIIKYKLKVINFSIFDSYCNSLLVNDYEKSKNFFITEWPNAATCELKRLSSQNDDFSLEIWAYKNGLSDEEVDKLIHSIQLQVTLNNKIYKNYNIYVNAPKK